MHEEVIAHMRSRIRRIREIMAMAHDPRMIEMLEKMIGEAEADIRTLEADREATPVKDQGGPAISA